uniref:Phosphoglycolate phosphatase n=1 Tax=Corethron hystrix TaxID=216773 RepID=A0A7S1C144_9STRA|mmetsp:Transcript_9908/g.22112  ORF Transcript_9908/g.22112 Transcript_9908/m.22112 type:complete len:394 (+) Transcript_9908:49-1230(+)
MLPLYHFILFLSVLQCSSGLFPTPSAQVTFGRRTPRLFGREATAATSPDVTETIRRESIEQYEEILADGAFSNMRKNGTMIFLEDLEKTSDYIHDNFDAILFDCDGVLYRGADPIPDASASLKALIRKGKNILFVTNNAGASRMQLRDKLANILDCEDLTEKQMVSSGYSAAKYLERALEDRGVPMDRANVHVIGSAGLCDELRSFRCRVTGGPSRDGPPPSMSREELADYSFAEEERRGKVDAVVVGLDTAFDYRKLCVAVVLLQRHPGCLLVATNEDAYDLVGSDARHLPGNGALVRAIEHASQRDAINVGKPSRILAELLSDRYGLDPSRTLFVGDRLDTDIKFGKDGGMKSALVLTGCTTVEKLIEVGMGTEEEPLPHIILPHMGLMGK